MTGAPDAPVPRAATRERVLPTGSMHVVIRFDRAPLVLFDDASGARPRRLGHGVVGGARSSYYVKSVVETSGSVGAQLVPGAAAMLFGSPASELAETHTSLDELFGADVSRTTDDLAEARTAERKLELFEQLLLSRIAKRTRKQVATSTVHPAVAEALAMFDAGASIASAVERSGYSHRTFLTLFRTAVGLTPKVYCRIQRFQQVLERVVDREAALVDVAFDAGYADQAHLTREFRAFAGITPVEYRMLAPASTNHVPILSSTRGETESRFKFLQDDADVMAAH
ncbi:Transcriptional regulator, AraC family [Labilithrix luteola]|uniref:Transcriptional regulator, AraC family n=1 Tax=Labilithrix luteola TaxID=1391654 RepID=A0A0K1Q277_9BACT|nr:Transcriptional regulator, AraC family [Labilithrix luteola]